MPLGLGGNWTGSLYPYGFSPAPAPTSGPTWGAPMPATPAYYPLGYSAGVPYAPAPNLSLGQPYNPAYNPSAPPPGYVAPPAPAGTYLGGTNPYWNPGQWINAGAGGYDWGNTPYGLVASEKAPEAAYMRYGSSLGIGSGDSAMDNWFRKQFGDVYTGYQAATISDPFININSYLNRLGGADAWRRRYEMTTTPQSRGEQNAAFRPVARWQGR